MTIEAFGFRVDKARRAQDAIDMYRNGSYAAIILDCNMPVKDGFDCAREIRMMDAKAGKRVAIIGFSSSSDIDIKDKCLNAGMDAFLPKDCTSARMKEVLTEWAGLPDGSRSRRKSESTLSTGSVLTLGQIEAISAFFEGKYDPAIKITIINNRDERDSICFSTGSKFYKCERISATKWLVISLQPDDKSEKEANEIENFD